MFDTLSISSDALTVINIATIAAALVALLIYYLVRHRRAGPTS